MCPELDEEVVERLKKSWKQVGPIYPVILTKSGKLVEGHHRLAAHPSWPRVRMKTDDPYKALQLRAILHGARRQVSEQETAQILRKMEVMLEKRGEKLRQNRFKKLAEDTGYSETYIHRLLSTYYPTRESTLPEVTSKPPPPSEKSTLPEVTSNPPLPPGQNLVRRLRRREGRLAS